MTQPLVADIGQKLDAVVDRALAEQRIVGAVVLVSEDGRPAYARAAAPQPSLADILGAAHSGNRTDSNAATNLTLSDAALAAIANAAAAKDFTTVTADARATLDSRACASASSAARTSA